MNSFYVVLIVASILSLSSAQSPSDAIKDYIAKFDQVEQAVCGKPITDDQVGNIISKCKCVNKDQEQTLVKTCLKVTDLTDRQFVTIFCDKPAKDCMSKAVTEMSAKLKPDEIAASGKGLDTYIACIKGILK